MPSQNERQQSIKSEKAARPRPVRSLRMGRVKAAIWENHSDDRTFHNVTFSRNYMDSDKKFKETDSFGRDDLPIIAKLADEAHTMILRDLSAKKSDKDEEV